MADTFNASKSRALPLAGKTLFFALFAYIFMASYPIGPYEPDGTTIANGTYFLDKTISNTDYSIKQAGGDGIIYRYDVQAGTYQLIRLGHLLTGVNYYSVFSIICSLSFVGVVFFGAQFLQIALNVPYWISGFAILAFPEMMVISGYPNSNIIALLFIALSFYLAIQASMKCTIISAISLSLAIWCRFDAVLVIPAYSIALWQPGKNGVKQLVLSGSIVAIFSPVLLLLSGSSIKAVLKALTQHGNQWEIPGFTIANYIAFYPLVLIFLALLGVIHLAKEKNHKYLLFSAIGTLPVFIAYGWTVTTGKYLLYTVIPLSVLILSGCHFIQKSRKLIQYPLLIIAILGMSYAYLPLGLPAYHAKVYSHDGPRTVTNLLSNPIKVHKEKFRKRKAFQEVANFLAGRMEIEDKTNIASCDRHEISANLMTQFLSMEDSQFKFIRNNPDHSKFLELTLNGYSSNFLALYSSSVVPNLDIESEAVNKAIYLVYWTKWPPDTEVFNNREVVYQNSRLTVEKAIWQ